MLSCAYPCHGVLCHTCVVLYLCHALATLCLTHTVSCHTIWCWYTTAQALLCHVRHLMAVAAHRCVHGLCLPLDALSYSCQCHQGYQGALCNQPSTPPDPCRLLSCHHGRCRLTPGGQPVCECHSGYSGTLCDQGRLQGGGFGAAALGGPHSDPRCPTEPECHGEPVRDYHQVQRGYAICQTTRPVPYVQCRGTCGGDTDTGCCIGLRPRRRKYAFECSNGATFVEEVEKPSKCGCSPCL